MSLLFKCLDWPKKAKEPRKLEGCAKSPVISGFGTGGIYISTPNNDSFIPADEFCEIIRYFMTNTDLMKNDPRLKLLKDLKKARKTNGYNGLKSRVLAF